MEFEMNADGTFKLDANGNKIPKANTDKSVEEVAKLKEDLTRVVEELKETREKKRLAEEAKAELEKQLTNPTPPTPPSEIAKEVERVLAEKEALRAQANKKAALNKFVSENKEFHPENDPSGLKREALERKLSQFNTTGLSEVNEFISVIKDAHRLLGGVDTPPATYKDIQNPYSSTPTPVVPPAPAPATDLSPKEKKLVETGSITKERLLKLKATNPDYLETLLEHVRA